MRVRRADRAGCAAPGLTHGRGEGARSRRGAARRYVSTPLFAAHDKDARRQRRAADRARREAEQALVQLHRRSLPPGADAGAPQPASAAGAPAGPGGAGAAGSGEGGGAARPPGLPDPAAGGGAAAGGGERARQPDGGPAHGAGGGDGDGNPFLAAPLWEDRPVQGCGAWPWFALTPWRDARRDGTHMRLRYAQLGACLTARAAAVHAQRGCTGGQGARHAALQRAERARRRPQQACGVGLGR